MRTIPTNRRRAHHVQLHLQVAVSRLFLRERSLVRSKIASFTPLFEDSSGALLLVYVSSPPVKPKHTKLAFENLLMYGLS